MSPSGAVLSDSSVSVAALATRAADAASGAYTLISMIGTCASGRTETA